VLRELTRFHHEGTGQLDPSIETLARRISRAPSAVARALARLRQRGFLDWLRRWAPVENPEPFGPQVEQVTNAYRFTMPPAAEKLLGVQDQAMPLPVDQEARAAEREEDWRTMFSAVPGHEKPRIALGDGPLADALGGLWAAAQRRRSAT